jgi:hypothetical protein
LVRYTARCPVAPNARRSPAPAEEVLSEILVLRYS